MRDFHCIRVKTSDLKKVIAVYDSLEQKGFIEFKPAGIFSGYVDVICENYNLVVRLAIANISFSKKQQCSCCCVDANEVLGYTANHKIDDNGNLVCDLVTKEELGSATASLRTEESDIIRKELIDIIYSVFTDDQEPNNSAGEGRHCVNLQISHPVVFVGGTDEEVNLKVEEYRKDKADGLTYIKIKKALVCLVPLQIT